MTEEKNKEEKKIENPYDAFIEENIIKKDYTKENFLSFLKEKNPKKELNQFPIEELYEILKDYYITSPDSSRITISCVKMEKTILNDKEIKTKIFNPRQIEGNFFNFQGKYILYDISTENFNWLVSRRYNDFIWLRECLIVMFPGQYVSPLPKKKIGNKRFEESFINKRMNKLQIFLNEILKNEDFKASEPMLAFLSLGDRIVFEHKMKILDPKTVLISTTDQMINLNGKINSINFSNQNYYVQFFNKFNNFYSYLGSTRKNMLIINNELKSFYDNLNNAALNLNKIYNCFNEISQSSNKLNLSTELEKNFDEYGNFFKNWGRILLNQNEVIKKNVHKFTKHFINDSEEYYDLFDRQQDFIKEFNSKHRDLLIKKENLWVSKNTVNWGITNFNEIDSKRILLDKNYALSIMLPKETNVIKIMELTLGYFFDTNSNHFLKFKNLLSKNLKESIENFSAEISITLNEGIQIWSSMQSNIV